jgi:hypothetical protein
MKHVRITDPYTIKQVERIRRCRGDKTLAKTARELIHERIHGSTDALLEKEGVSMPEASAGQGHGHGGPTRRKQPRRSAA